MHPRHFARSVPDKAAVVMAATGEVISYRALEDNSNRAAQLFRSVGLKPGDAIAIFMVNDPQFLELCWGAQRCGLYFTAVSSRLTAGEVEYIVKDCGAKLFFASHALASTALELAPLLPGVELLSVGGAIDGYREYEQAVCAMPAVPVADECAGTDMLYSSGTTGRPKGVKVEIAVGQSIDVLSPVAERVRDSYDFGEDTVYLSPAPLYHSAPLRYCMAVHRLGGTVVVMDHFDAENVLRLIARYKVTAAQFVPTMFVRMLKLTEAQRRAHDLSSLKTAVHAAAPCPVEVKKKMIEWLGPIIHEYYSGTEGCGITMADSFEWLGHPGTVGKPQGCQIHICDEDGRDVPVGVEGTVYFAGGPSFAYHNDSAKTAGARHPAHPDWATLGDVGKLDADGYLYLTDRKAFMIISGGVNIYPQEAENVLINHPGVADVAVIGVPSPDFGEDVKAVVQPVDWEQAGAALEAELIAYCRERLSHIKCPRSVDFERELPRHPTGKLYKRLIRDRYWGKREQRIV